MLRARLFTRAARFHSAAVRRNAQLQTDAAPRADNDRPSVILGTRPHEEETRWAECALAKCLVNHRMLNGPPPSFLGELIQVPEFAPVAIPRDTNFGVGPVEKQMLFEELPRLSQEASVLRNVSPFTRVFEATQKQQTKEPQLTHDQELEQGLNSTEAEMAKVEAFSKVIDLRNANAKGIAYENRRRIILAFSSPKNPYNPGRTEVQAAILTYEIRNLWSHLTTFKRDIDNRKALRQLVHKRAKVLKYLKKKSRDRYEALLPRLALEPAAVEGELVV